MEAWENGTGTYSYRLEGATVEWLPRISLVSSICPGRGRSGTQVAAGLEDVASRRTSRQFRTASHRSVRKVALADEMGWQEHGTRRKTGRDERSSMITMG